MFDLIEDGLTESESIAVSDQLRALGEEINIPGVTELNRIQPIEIRGEKSTVVVSPVGASTLSYTVSGKEIFTRGTAPFGVPTFANGRLGYVPPIDIVNIEYYSLGPAGKDREVDSLVRERILSLTGKSIEDYMFWTHSGHQVAIYNTSENIDPETGSRVIFFQKDFEPTGREFPANIPWKFRHVKSVMLDKHGLVETHFIRNLSNFPIPTSFTANMFLNIIGGDADFQNSSIYSGEYEHARKVYDLQQYEAIEERCERQLRPLCPYVFLRSPDKIVEMFFGGDFDLENSGLKIYSPWPRMEDLRRESFRINEINRMRWQEAVDFASKLGIKRLSEMTPPVVDQNLSVCIQPQTSGDHVYRKENGFARAVILEPYSEKGDCKIYTIRTRARFV